jgi:hypothetical protein
VKFGKLKADLEPVVFYTEIRIVSISHLRHGIRWSPKAMRFGLNEFGVCVARELDFNKFVFIAILSTKKGDGKYDPRGKTSCYPNGQCESQ